ncbi:TPA: cation:dicarboxylase symporter family transporter [Candidatus Galligastranaerophilus intestinigallinarum]|nr:cation:dicarboxylase symporter family transporter [Candidatus Galligastranaerophilus intestinigallinarum]
MSKSSKLTLFIFLALVLGVIFGWLDPAHASKMQPVADAFLKMVKMIIAPLIFATLVVGIAGHGDVKNLGKIGLKTIIYFEIITTFALVLGLVMANIFKPGVDFNIDLSNVSMAAVEKMQNVHIDHSLTHMILDMIPTSVFKAMAEGNLLQIVVFAIFFALAICAVGQKARPVLDFLHSTCEIMFKFTEYVMFFAPLGVFGAISATIGQNGIGILSSYAKLIVITYASLILFVIGVLFIACKIINVPFRSLLVALKEPALLAFTTASSEAALPKAMDVMEKFGVPKNIVSFVMPTGYTFNLDGSTLYLSLTALFCAQIAGVELNISQQLAIMLTLMLTSKGIAGVPRVSLVVLTGTLAGFHLPVIGVAILLGIDQILDMGRTTVNLIGNCVATAVVAKWENAFDYEKMHLFIKDTIQSKKNIQIKEFTKKQTKVEAKEENYTSI